MKLGRGLRSRYTPPNIQKESARTIKLYTNYIGRYAVTQSNFAVSNKALTRFKNENTIWLGSSDKKDVVYRSYTTGHDPEMGPVCTSIQEQDSGAWAYLVFQRAPFDFSKVGPKAPP